MRLVERSIGLAGCAIKALEFLSPLIDLAIRLFVANVFWKAGMTKLSSWDSTIYLFSEEYAVPFLPPEIAAMLATATELGGAVLIALGIGARFGAAALFVLNVVAVISYPGINEVGREHHIYWGILLLVILLHGPGKLSLDHIIRKRLMGRNKNK